MSRNSERTKVNQNFVQPPAPPGATQGQAPASKATGLNFVVPTEIVYLPSGGNFYDDASPLKGVKSVEIRAMTSKEEDILMNESFISEGIVFDKLIDSLLVTNGISSRDILDCDKVAILMSARKTGYGDELTVLFECESCGNQEEVELKYSTIIEGYKDKTFSIEENNIFKYDEASKTAAFELPVTKATVRIRTMSPADYEYLQQSKKQKEKLNLPYSDTVEFLRRVLVEANGIATPSELFKFAEVLPTADARKIRKVHNLTIPTIDKSQIIICSQCAHEQKEDMPFSLGMFWNI